jgi:hypothetical protein
MLTGVEDFQQKMAQLKMARDKARIWPQLACLFLVRSTSVQLWLLALMDAKKSKLSVAADVNTEVPIFADLGFRVWI